MNKKVLTILVAIVVVAVVGIALYVFVFSGDGKEAAPVYTDFPISEAFITNVNDDYSIFKTGITLILNTNDSNVISLLDSKIPQIRDTIISVLRRLDNDTLIDPDNYDAIKERLVTALNEVLTDERGELLEVVHGVYFTDYYVQ